MRRFLSPTALTESGSRVQLDKDASHHLLRVNQTPRGSSVLVYDSEGMQAAAQLIDVEQDCAILELTETPSPAPQLSERILLIGQPKRAALEHILRMSTELGCTEIRIFEAHRSIAKGAHLARWKRVTEGCLSQCGRTSGPEITHFQSLEKALCQLPETGRWICSPTAPPPGESRPKGTVLLVGPEGGFSTKETDLARESGFQALNLNAQVLRCDTAVAAGFGVLT